MEIHVRHMGLANHEMLLAYEFMAVLAQTMTSPSAPDAITEAISVDTILARFWCTLVS